MIPLDGAVHLRFTICKCYSWRLRSALALLQWRTAELRRQEHWLRAGRQGRVPMPCRRDQEEQISRNKGYVSAQSIVNQRGEVTIPDPPLAHALFSTTRFAWLWAILRLYLGWQWLTSGWGKIWARWASGESLKGFVNNAVKVPESGKPPIAFDWYRDFILLMLDRGWYTWFADVIHVGRVLDRHRADPRRVRRHRGLFRRVSELELPHGRHGRRPNGLLFAIAIVLMLAWKVAGWYGLDRWLLSLIGTPWHRDQMVSAIPGHTLARTIVLA